MANIYEIKTESIIKENVFFLAKQLWTDWQTKAPKGSIITVYHYNNGDDNSYTTQIKLPIPPQEITVKPNQQIELENLVGYVFLTSQNKLGTSFKADNIKPFARDWRLPNVNTSE